MKNKRSSDQWVVSLNAASLLWAVWDVSLGNGLLMVAGRELTLNSLDWFWIALRAWAALASCVLVVCVLRQGASADSYFFLNFMFTAVGVMGVVQTILLNELAFDGSLDAVREICVYFIGLVMLANMIYILAHESAAKIDADLDEERP